EGRGRGPHLAVMAAALAAGIYTHYFAVLAAVPIAAGELTRQIVRRRLDADAWAAFVAAAAASTPLLWLARTPAAARATFWARPSAVDVARAFEFVLGDLPAAAVVVVVLVALLARLQAWRDN